MTARVIGFPKVSTYRNAKIRDSARGKDCLMLLPGICLRDPATTIWSHYRGSAGGKARGLKADDLCGCYACTACDAVYDGQRPRPRGMSIEYVELSWHVGHIKSIVILHADGLI
jgi:hypothetical protein